MSEEKHAGGRPPIAIDLDELEKLCGLQCTQRDLAGWFNVHLHTIENRVKDDTEYDHHGVFMTFAEIMERGYAKGRVSLRRRQMENADKGNATMQIWLGKQLLGQRDIVEHSGIGGGPIEHTDVPASQLLADRIARIIERNRESGSTPRPS